jgi:hypothetical protein
LAEVSNSRKVNGEDAKSSAVRGRRAPLRTEWLEGEAYEINPDGHAMVRGNGGGILFVVSRASACLPDLIYEFTARIDDRA